MWFSVMTVLTQTHKHTGQTYPVINRLKNIPSLLTKDVCGYFFTAAQNRCARGTRIRFKIETSTEKLQMT